MITDQEKSTLQAFSALLPVVMDILNRKIDETQIDSQVPTSSTILSVASSRRARVIYKGIPLYQNAAVHKLLQELAPLKTEAELHKMFSTEAIFNSNRRQQQIIVTPQEHANFTEDYQTRYNVDEPIITKDNVKLYVWTNWGFYKTVGKEKIEDATPKFIRIAQSHGIDIQMPEEMQ